MLPFTLPTLPAKVASKGICLSLARCLSADVASSGINFLYNRGGLSLLLFAFDTHAAHTCATPGSSSYTARDERARRDRYRISSPGSEGRDVCLPLRWKALSLGGQVLFLMPPRVTNKSQVSSPLIQPR